MNKVMPVNEFRIIVSAYELPPPYTYSYVIEAKYINPDNWQLTVDYQYLDREELEDYEILEEGFSLENEIKASAMLPATWNSTIQEWLQHIRWIEDHRPQSPGEPEIVVAIRTGEKTEEGIPQTPNEWIYRAEELVQAVYELSEREKPLLIQVNKIPGNGNPVKSLLTVSFARREAILVVGDADRQMKKKLTWKEVKKLMELIYLPDYDPDRIEKGKPKKEGIYIDLGDDQWYKFHKAVNNPGLKRDVLKEIEQSFFA